MDDSAFDAAIEAELVRMLEDRAAAKRKRKAVLGRELRKADAVAYSEAQRRYHERNPEKVSAQRREFRKRNSKRIVEQRRKWRAKMMASPTRYARYLEVKKASQNRIRLRNREQNDKRQAAPLISVRVKRDNVYAACAGAVPGGIPLALREDVVGDIVVAVLSGELSLNEVKTKAQLYLRPYSYRFKEWSLDAPIPGSDGKLTYLDRLAAPEQAWMEAAE